MTERDPPYRLAGDVVGGPLRGETVWRLEPDANGTRAGFRIAVDVAQSWMEYWVPVTWWPARSHFRMVMEQCRRGLARQLTTQVEPLQS